MIVLKKLLTISYFNFVLLFVNFSISNAFRDQSTAVMGKLMCGNNTASKVSVKLYDKDTGPDPDDLLDSTVTGSDGTFKLQGDTMELTSIDPEVRIYHKCNMHLPLCSREWIIKIPSKYITQGKNPKYVMDLGSLNLEIELDGEDRHKCIH